MWNNSQWEQENQELLKEWYLDKVTGKAPDSAVRKIHCEGCGGIFYTRIHSKRYCNCWCAKLGNWKHQRQRRLAARADRVCAVCGKKFTPARSDALYCSNACRQSAYRQRVTAKASVQIGTSRSQKAWDLSIILNEAGHRAGAGGPFWLIGSG